MTHGSYRAPRPVWWLGCLIATTSGQMGPSRWKAHHLQHPRQLPAGLEADPLLRLLDRLNGLPPLALSWLSWQLGGLEWLGAFCLSTTLLFHGVASVNPVAHLVSARQGLTVPNGRVPTLSDPTYRCIRQMERWGWAWDLRIPSDRPLLARARAEAAG